MGEEYKKLSKIVYPTGTGIPGLTATLVDRDNNKAIYVRSDGVWEVFFIKRAPAELIYDKSYPERELYPSNEDFGKSAWCYPDESLARKRYDELKKRGVSDGSNNGVKR